MFVSSPFTLDVVEVHVPAAPQRFAILACFVAGDPRFPDGIRRLVVWIQNQRCFFSVLTTLTT